MFVAGVQWNPTDSGPGEPNNTEVSLPTPEPHRKNREPRSSPRIRYSECLQQSHQENR